METYLNGGTIDWLVWGDTSAPPVLLFPGFMGTALDWAQVVGEMDGAYCFLAPTLPGASAEDRARRDIHQALSIEAIALELSASLHLLESRYQIVTSAGCSIVGYSMGGRIALSLVAQNPKIAHALVLLSTNPGISDDEERRQRLARDQSLAVQIETQGLQAFLTSWYSSSVFSSLSRTPVLQASLIERRVSTNDPQWVAKLLVELSPGGNTSHWELLPTLAQRQLWVAGALDQKYSEMLGAVATLAAVCETHIVKDVGHALHLESPQQCARLLSGFLAAS